MKILQLTLLLLAMNVCVQAQHLSSLEPEDFQKNLTKPEVQILDVRTAGEYQTAHIKSSLQADWNNKQQFKDRVQYLDKNRPVMIYCAAGGRSHAAAGWLEENGFTNIQELKGGMTAWKLKDMPTEGVAAVKQMTLDEYTTAINSNKLVLVDFGAEWCPPCKKMEPVLKALQQDLKSSFQLVKVDGGINTDVMKLQKVEALPVFIIYKDGKETWRREGVASLEELKAALTKSKS